MKSKSLGLVACAALALLTLAGCAGHDGDHEAGAATASSGLALDRAFAAEMIPHHESAIEMAEIAQDRGESAFVRELAADIVNSQADEIETLTAAETRLANAGVERGSLGLPDHMAGMSGDTDSLKTVDRFDEAFLKLMIPDHEGAVAMSKVLLANGQDPDLKAIAQAILVAQEEEISQMRSRLGVDAPMPSEHH
jgi:uncharacterized protein (DUF305 family)